LDGKYDKQEAIRLLKRNSRRYAKRQMTWFKKDPHIIWHSPNDLQLVIESIEKELQN
jgi:tRNA dimethylallyltransferase